jgi:hypothetical protein
VFAYDFFVSFDAVAMYAGGLVIGGIPKARVARPVRRVYVIHAPRHHSAAIIQPQGAELMFRCRQIPAGVFAPSGIISALPGAAPPLVLGVYLLLLPPSGAHRSIVRRSAHYIRGAGKNVEVGLPYCRSSPSKMLKGRSLQPF